MMNLVSVSTMEIIKNHKYSIIVYGDYRHIRNNDIIEVSFDGLSKLNGKYLVSRVYYSTKRDESTIIIRR